MIRHAVCAEPADVTDRESFEEALGLLIAQFGPVDVLVTSAGGAQPGHFERALDDVFEQQMEVNYFGTLHPIRAVVPSMIERGRGHLMLVSSAAGIIGVYGYSAYAPAKFAVRGLAETLRAELKPHGIVVGCAYPPDTDTPGLEAESGDEARGDEDALGDDQAALGRTPSLPTIVRGIEHDRLVVTSDIQTALLARGRWSARARRACHRRPPRAPCARCGRDRRRAVGSSRRQERRE